MPCAGAADSPVWLSTTSGVWHRACPSCQCLRDVTRSTQTAASNQCARLMAGCSGPSRAALSKCGTLEPPYFSNPEQYTKFFVTSCKIILIICATCQQVSLHVLLRSSCLWFWWLPIFNISITVKNGFSLSQLGLLQWLNLVKCYDTFQLTNKNVTLCYWNICNILALLYNFS